jgi:hypothetical protein
MVGIFKRISNVQPVKRMLPLDASYVWGGEDS